MNPEATNELVWHFAGYLHLVEDYSASRLKYDAVSYDGRTSSFRPDLEHHQEASQADAAELSSYAVRVSYSPKYDGLKHADPVKLPEKLSDTAPPAPQAPSLEVAIVKPLAPSGDIHQVFGRGDHGQPTPSDGAGPGSGGDPVYKIEYSDELGSQHANLTQLNVMTDRDYFSDGNEQYSGLQHVPVGDAIPDMLDAAHEFVPDLFEQPGTGMEFWTAEVIAHDEAMASGEITGEALAAGRYVNGELQEPAPAEVETPDPIAPVRPERAEGDASPAQVAELGGNTAQNVALIADVNEAPATLIVMGDYYETNTIIQANVFQNQDHVLESGSSLSIEIKGGDNQTDNIATFAVKEVAQQVVSQQYAGDLHVHIDFVDGDLFDIKALTQRNYIDDGDVTVQTQYNAYSEVVTGGNEQTNVARFEDWGKDYDIIIVLGDYHSANIISQTNIVLDSDIVGVGNGMVSSGGAAGGGGASQDSSVFTGQNTLRNEAVITQYGATTFVGINGDLESLIASLNNRETLDANAWSSFHGTATGSLNILFVTGDYYDLNVISQINVIADADLAVQVNAGSGSQWLSVGGNTAINAAEIIDAGGLQNQYLGGAHYEDSVLVQANLVSDETNIIPTSPTALVPELIAFLDQAQDGSLSEGETWTTSTYTNHDTFGHVLS